ncbi:valine--tRNA ligase [Harpegnathos saltator]|uniref:Valine--tRNA ligase n=1 Tax=Harpegnathos saltator TaxID=610380 RepID=E2BNA9_HARSA|nr:valine--tRNA ligase [Harpegnathos saltator]XP_025158826.1 valine--tRNA ligase [Harpegnathos saltator]EFN82871.1 Valyl-tRNA synthetase [Harpegnathos saltator]
MVDAKNEEIVENGPQKTAKQLQKEAKKLAKLEKFKQKQEKKEIEKSVNVKEKPEKNEKKKETTSILYTVDTPPGERKDISCPLPDTYSPQYVEAAWYAWWEKEGFFKPEYGGKDIFKENPKRKLVIIMPPPNVTGFLHLGHALTNAVEDAIVRWNRMKGLTTLWDPGCDHAGIATQVVVEKKLWKEEKKSRHDIGREEFIKKIWQWKHEKGNRIYSQLRKIGSSCDWSRVFFTMEPKLYKAVTEAFVRLHDEGIIYRSNRLVNWSCALKSAISDIEVDKMELSGRTLLSIPGYKKKVEFGVLISFAYQLIDSDDKIVVATTRIETMLGDTAVAVHPKDSRYAHYIGKYILHPFCDRRIPILADKFVDMEFGTGAVKITPAHDPNDYEVGKRHDLPFINIFNDDGCIIGDYGKFTGMKRFEARVAILEELTKRNLLIDVKDNSMVIPICSRSKDVVEPLIKPQWYVKCDEMAAQAKKVVETGDLKIIPQQFEKTWYLWMDGIRDWCISRQLWWGHRIPAYAIKLVDSCSSINKTGETFWVSAHSEIEAKEKAAKKLGIDVNQIIAEQDSDVLDTWFSSALLPFSSFGWPDQTPELKAFYPGTLLETGHDILFFWVARMVFMGQKLLGQLPFREVYLHAMVRDAHGRKMSKSLGNVIDPMDVIKGISLEDLQKQLLDSNLDPKELDRAREGQKRDYPHGIPECGTDALRFTLCAYTTQGRDINLDVLRIQGYRFFCNKIWNATKFALTYFAPQFKYDENHTLHGNDKKDTRQHNNNSVDTDLEGAWYNKYHDWDLHQPSIQGAINHYLADHPYLDGYTPTQLDPSVHQLLKDSDINFVNYPHLKRWYDHIETFTDAERAKFAKVEMLKNIQRKIEDTFELTDLNEKNVHLWMLSRISYAAKTSNEAMAQYDFALATSICHNLWLYELCDIYLEYLKPIFQSEDNAAKLAAQKVLFKTMDVALRLLSPFMPFITEELYQRLPRKEQIHPSICISPYPNVAECPWRNYEIEEDVEFMQKIIKNIRSARATYNLPNKTKTDAFVVCRDQIVKEKIDQYKLLIETLAYSVLKVNEPPAGCAIITVTDKIQVHLLLEGLIDAEKELEKLHKKKEQLDEIAQKLKQESNMPDYETKVPLSIRETNKEKLSRSEGELIRIVDAMAILHAMSCSK